MYDEFGCWGLSMHGTGVLPTLGPCSWIYGLDIVHLSYVFRASHAAHVITWAKAMKSPTVASSPK
jgi:hypothetical protein